MGFLFLFFSLKWREKEKKRDFFPPRFFGGQEAARGADFYWDKLGFIGILGQPSPKFFIWSHLDFFGMVALGFLGMAPPAFWDGSFSFNLPLNRVLLAPSQPRAPKRRENP